MTGDGDVALVAGPDAHLDLVGERLVAPVVDRAGRGHERPDVDQAGRRQQAGAADVDVADRHRAGAPVVGRLGVTGELGRAGDREAAEFGGGPVRERDVAAACPARGR